MFNPPSLRDAEDGTRGTLLLPNFGGGTNWEGGAVDPETGIVYVGSITNPAVFSVDEPEAGMTDMSHNFTGGQVPSPMDLPIVKPPYGRITAIDLNTGEHVWMKPNGTTPEEIANHPALQGLDIPETGKPVRPVLLVTKTLLIAGE